MKTVVASGGFDPLHVGHIEYLEKSKQLVGPNGKLVVIVNSDKFLMDKKGYVFMPWGERVAIIRSLRCVDEVFPCIDMDGTVIKSLTALRPDIFAKGGDRNANNIPEQDICKMLGIRIVDGLGPKIQSSQFLAEAMARIPIPIREKELRRGDV